MRTPATSIAEVGHEELVAVLKSASAGHDGCTAFTPDEVLRHIADRVIARLTHTAGPLCAEETTLLVDHLVAEAIAGADLAAATEVLRTALRALLRHLWGRATPDDQPRLLRVNAWCVALEPAVVRKAHHALARANSSKASAHRSRSELAAALVAGDQIRAADVVAARITLPGTYGVVYLLAPPGCVVSEDVLPSSGLPDEALTVPDGGRNLVLLLPLRSDAPGPPGVDDFIAELATSVGAPVSAGMSWPRSLSGVPGAVAEARTIARLAAAAERSGGCTIDDVLVEWALSRAEPARERLSGLLATLAGGPDLLATLDALYRHDLDRTAAAAAMHVHRATLDYRLKKVQEMCGFDPLTPQGVRLLASALFYARLDLIPK